MMVWFPKNDGKGEELSGGHYQSGEEDCSQGPHDGGAIHSGNNGNGIRIIVG